MMGLAGRRFDGTWESWRQPPPGAGCASGNDTSATSTRSLHPVGFEIALKTPPRHAGFFLARIRRPARQSQALQHCSGNRRKEFMITSSGGLGPCRDLVTIAAQLEIIEESLA